MRMARRLDTHSRSLATLVAVVAASAAAYGTRAQEAPAEFPQPPLPSTGPSLERRVQAVRDDTVRMSYAAREGVCGNGAHGYSSGQRSTEDWLRICASGPVRVQIRMAEGRVTGMSIYIGGEWRAREGVADLGTVAADEASAFFLNLAERAPASVAGDALAAAMLADAPDPWQRLAALARDDSRDANLRETAIFWLGQSAAREATRSLADIAEDDAETVAMQKAAVFSLSQRDEPERIDQLIRVARTHAHPEVVKAALFWLAESADARAVGLFEEILTSAGAAGAAAPP